MCSATLHPFSKTLAPQGKTFLNISGSQWVNNNYYYKCLISNQYLKTNIKRLADIKTRKL